MTTFNTGNPIGSTDARDRLDNTENMDYLENSTTELTRTDRLGTVRKTRHGMEAEHDAQMQSFEDDFDSRLAGMAFTRVGTFTGGYTLTDMRQTMLWEISQGGDGHEYGWAGTFPKVVAAGSTPATAGGIGAGAWVDRTDDTLKSNLTDEADFEKGSALVGRSVSTFLTTQEAISNYVRVGQICKTKGFYSTKDGGGADWLVVNTSDVTPNGTTIIQSTYDATKSIELLHDGVVNIMQVGAREGHDCSDVINTLFADPSVNLVTAVKKTFIANSTICATKDFNMRGASFDFSSAAPNTNSFSAYNSISDINFEDVKIHNSKRAALIGSGTNSRIRKIKVYNAVKQGINWQGIGWQIEQCYVDTVQKEFGILNGGNSKQFKINNNVCKNIALAGGIELGYQFSNCEVSSNQVFDSYMGYQVYPNISGAGSDLTQSNIVLKGNSSFNCSNKHYHIKNDYTGSSIVLAEVTLENNNLSGGIGIGYQIENTKLARIIGGSTVGLTSGWHIYVTGGCGLVEVSGVKFKDSPTNAAFIHTLQDNVHINGCGFNNGYAIVSSTSGNAFTDILLIGCETKSVTIPHINLTEYSIKYWEKNSFTTPFTSAVQLLGSYTAGYKRYYTNPQPSGSIGLVCTTSGVYGSTAVFKTFGVISA